MGSAGQQEIDRPVQTAVHATLFGEFALTTAEGSEIAISNRRARAVLAMLCLARDASIDRDHLSKLLWPGRFEAHAKASLRQCLLDLGKLLAPLECPIIDVSRSKINLNAAAVQSDLDDLEGALQRAQFDDAADRLASIGTKPMLDQMDFGDGFNAWLAAHRSRAEHRLHTAVASALGVLQASGDAVGHEKLLDAWSPRHALAKTNTAHASPTGKTRIAVLPFHSLDAQEGHDYFADGMVDELITALGQVPQLMVAGRTSSFHFRGSDLSPIGIADALRVSHLIKESVQRQGDRVRIHAHVIAGDSGFELWSARFDGSLDDVFALQEKVAQAVTAAIGPRLAYRWSRRWPMA